MSENQPPSIAPGPSADGSSLPEGGGDVPEAKAISEHEVGEYREQDRFLPVGFSMFWCYIKYIAN